MTLIGETMQTILIREGIASVMWGDARLLDECANLCNIEASHPLNRWQKVLNGLERDWQRFDKGYVRIDGCWQGKRSRKVRCFTLKYHQKKLPNLDSL